jgi:hypothetical protein
MFRLSRVTGRGYGSAVPSHPDNFKKRALQTARDTKQIEKDLVAETSPLPKLAIQMEASSLPYIQRLQDHGYLNLHLICPPIRGNNLLKRLQASLFSLFKEATLGLHLSSDQERIKVHVIREGTSLFFSPERDGYGTILGDELPTDKKFCPVPPHNIIAEMEYAFREFGVEDLSPSIEHMLTMSEYRPADMQLGHWYPYPKNAAFLLSTIKLDLLRFLATLPGTPTT